jgi:hypothetical protein
LGKLGQIWEHFGIQGSQEAFEGGGYNCKNFKHETTWQWIKLVLIL